MDRRRARARLGSTLIKLAGWLTADDVGPRSVDAGACDRCGVLPRLVPTCGPAGFEALCRDCALRVGDLGWCDGHLDDGRAARRWAEALGDEWAEVVILYWISTGEIRSDDSWARSVELHALPAEARAAAEALISP